MLWRMNTPPHDEIPSTTPLTPVAAAVNDECFTVVDAIGTSIPKAVEPIEPAIA